MIFQAILSNKAHPEYGVATIPFPIPSDQYDHIIELLEAMSVGAATAQDCWVDELTSGYPILNLLAAQSVDLDELDYLASGWSVWPSPSRPQSRLTQRDNHIRKF